jgi:hypothetical protein
MRRAFFALAAAAAAAGERSRAALEHLQRRRKRLLLLHWRVWAARKATASHRRAMALTFGALTSAGRAWRGWWAAVAASRRLDVAGKAVANRSRQRRALSGWRDAAVRCICARLRVAAADRNWLRRCAGRALASWAAESSHAAAERRSLARVTVALARSQQRRALRAWRRGAAAGATKRLLVGRAALHRARYLARMALLVLRAEASASRAAAAELRRSVCSQAVTSLALPPARGKLPAQAAVDVPPPPPPAALFGRARPPPRQLQPWVEALC